MTSMVGDSCGLHSGRKARLLRDIGLCIACCVVPLWSPSALAQDNLDRPITLDIATNTRLEDALIEWGAKAGVTVMINTSTVRERVAPAVHGTLSAREALRRLLENSGLAFSEDGNRIQVVPRAPYVRSSSRSDGTDTLPSGGSVLESTDSGDASTPTASSEGNLEQVIVSAEKREERLQDVPIPIGVLSADYLTETNQLLLSDWSTSVPGLTASTGDRTMQLTIRGISSGLYTNPTVGVTIDDVPFTGSTNIAGDYQPDIDPGSLERIEVLRGPQGTLYGASSMGGLVRYVTKNPSTQDGFSGRMQAGTSAVYNGAEAGYNVRGSFNVAITDKLAVRISGFTRQDPGYIDDVLSGARGVNEGHTSGAMLTAMWRPTDFLSLKINALYQHANTDGADSVEKATNGYSGPPLGDLQQYFIENTAWTYNRVQFYSADLRLRIAGAEIASITGFSANSYGYGEDLSQIFGPTFSQLANVPNLGGALVSRFGLRKFSQELRATVPFGQKFEWLIGAFYTTERGAALQLGNAVQPVGGAVVANEYAAYDSGGGGLLSEYAAFTDLTYKFTDTFDVQVGGRESRITNFSDANTTSGNLFGGTTITPPFSGTAVHAFTWLVTPRYKLAPDTMVYARVASGYQAGGPINQGYAPGDPLYDPNVPTHYNSSKLKNYEIGLKSDFLDRALSVDTSVYYIDWTAIQIEANSPINYTSYLFNAGKAKSEGVELSMVMTPVQGLSISGWAAFNDAVLTQDIPVSAAVSVVGVSGDRLPFGSRFSANLAIDEHFQIVTDFAGFVGASANYVGQRYGSFVGTEQREIYPEYTRVDLRAGITHGPWTAELYAKNVGNVRGLVGGGLGAVPPYAYNYITPRTVGVNLSTKL